MTVGMHPVGWASQRRRSAGPRLPDKSDRQTADQGLVMHLLAQVKSSESQDRDAIDDSSAFWFHAPPQKAAGSNGPVVMQVAYPPPPEPPMPPVALREFAGHDGLQQRQRTSAATRRSCRRTPS